MGLFGHFDSEQSNEIETGRAASAASPLGEFGVHWSTAGAECENGSRQQSAVSRNGEDRLFGHRSNIPKLRLADAQSVLFFAVIDVSVNTTVSCNVMHFSRGPGAGGGCEGHAQSVFYVMTQ